MTIKTINLAYINSLDQSQAEETFLKCSGSTIWAQAMTTSRPYATEDEVKSKSESAWNKLSRNDWLMAFAIHPKIGDRESLRKKFASTAHWAANEQGGVDNACEETIERLAERNTRYENKFGYIFIVCATGKSAAEMLALLEQRLTNNVDSEFAIACNEQKKITQLRLEKLDMSAITTHVLDTSKGRPAAGVAVLLEFKSVSGWVELAKGTTNDDGRVTNLLPKDKAIAEGIYRLTFDSGRYYLDNQMTGFYPQVSIIFEIKDPTQHHHVPLLLNPFGYSTYRGS